MSSSRLSMLKTIALYLRRLETYIRSSAVGGCISKVNTALGFLRPIGGAKVAPWHYLEFNTKGRTSHAFLPFFLSGLPSVLLSCASRDDKCRYSRLLTRTTFASSVIGGIRLATSAPVFCDSHMALSPEHYGNRGLKVTYGLAVGKRRDTRGLEQWHLCFPWLSTKKASE